MYKQIDTNKRKTFLLITLFLIFVIGLGWFFSYIYNNFFILVVAVIFSILMSFSSYWWSDKIVLAISRAHPADPETDKPLYRLVENLSITAGLPMPRIYIIEDSAPNAFATGRNPSHAVICVTRGLLDKLEKSELEGVLAHELSHIGNYDILLMTVVVILAGFIALLSDWFLRFSFFGRRRDGGGEGNIGLVLFLIGIVLALITPLIATLIKMAISRKREFLADASGALLTRYPEGLARALEKIAADNEPLEVANKATAHLYITNPLKEHKGTSRGWFANLFNTHPPIEERIKRLREMAL